MYQISLKLIQTNQIQQFDGKINPIWSQSQPILHNELDVVLKDQGSKTVQDVVKSVPSTSSKFVNNEIQYIDPLVWDEPFVKHHEQDDSPSDYQFNRFQSILREEYQKYKQQTKQSTEELQDKKKTKNNTKESCKCLIF